MNELVYRNLSEDAKRQICAWKYGGEYDLYNLPAYEEMQVRQIGFMNPQSEKNYYGFWDESILVGFVMKVQKSYILTSRCIWKFVHGIPER